MVPSTNLTSCTPVIIAPGQLRLRCAAMTNKILATAPTFGLIMLTPDLRCWDASASTHWLFRRAFVVRRGTSRLITLSVISSLSR